MLQNDEALYYGKPHRCYITPKSLVIIGVISINFKVIILFLLVANLIRGCTPPNCLWLYPQLSLTFMFAQVYWLYTYATSTILNLSLVFLSLK